MYESCFIPQNILHCQDIEKKPENTILSNGTLDVGDVNGDIVYYRSVGDNGFVNNRSSFYFVKENTTFYVALSTFNYDTDRNMTLDFVTYLVETLRVNHKV